MDDKKHQKMPSSQFYQNNHQLPDEINLLEIFSIFLKHRWLIIGITGLCTILAVCAALLLPPEYESEVTVLPPLAETVEKLNIPNIFNQKENAEKYFFEIEPQDLYAKLILNLQSNQSRKQFFDDHNLIKDLSTEEDERTNYSIFQDDFSDKMSVTGMPKTKEDIGFITVTLRGDDPIKIVNWLNDFIRFADKKTIFEQTQAFKTKTKMFVHILSTKMESLRTTEQSRRLDKIEHLNEALTIAKQLGWTEQSNNLNLLYEQVKEEEMGLSFSLQDMPLYLRGSQALQAEIESLIKRKNNDPFIPDLRDFQEELNLMASLKQNTTNIHAMRLDQTAVVDERPVKPRRKLIVLAGLTIGLLFSLLLALLKNAIIQRDRIKEQVETIKQ